MVIWALLIAVSALRLRRGTLDSIDSAAKPTDFSYSGCRKISKLDGRVDAPRAGRLWYKNSCFAFCQSKKTMYFGLEDGGKTCWCAKLYHGSDGKHGCTQKCDGTDQPCGGPRGSGFASVYIAFDCTPPTQKEIEEKAAADRAEVEKMYKTEDNFTCIAQDNALKVKNEATMVGSVYDCKLACNSEMTCHGFTYEKESERMRCLVL
eukprot:GEMP01058922.1.p1 GENE.GEMP01058922.1~~GEMP01058922.1.p1  ORF type:complete len:206 (+),score=47.25 GEMP01058922.1:193-810(+)